MKLKVFLFVILNFIYSSQLFCGENVSFSLPKKDWGITVNLSGFCVKQNIFGVGKSERDITIEAGRKISGTVSVFENIESAAECCSRFVNNFKLQNSIIQSLTESQIDDIFYVYYDIETQNNEILKGFACFLNKDDKGASVSLLAKENASSFLPASKKILTSFKIVDNYQPQISERLVLGKYYFDNQDFFSALDIFEPILENTLLQKVLSDDDYRTLINISSAAYNVVGLPELGIKLLDEGICRLPEDSIFYYNLAAIYALYEMEDKVLYNLEKAYRFKAKNMNLVCLPNPFQDSAFQTFLMNSDNYREVSNLVGWFAIP